MPLHNNQRSQQSTQPIKTSFIRFQNARGQYRQYSVPYQSPDILDAQRLAATQQRATEEHPNDTAPDALRKYVRENAVQGVIFIDENGVRNVLGKGEIP